jgi:acetyl esterase
MTQSRVEAAPGIDTVDAIVTGRNGHPIPIRDYMPASTSSSRPFLWVHGGGFMGGGLDQRESDAVARAIAATGRPVRTVDYRLAPTVNFRGRLKLKPSENRYPGPMHDVTDTFLDLTRSHPGLAPILGGASAGANLALATSVQLRDGEGPVPAGLVLVYGTFHGRPAPVSDELRSRLRVRDRALAVVIGPDALERMNANYAGSMEGLDDHAAFPGGGDLRRLPPAYLLDADHDGLRASGEQLARELNASGVRTASMTLRDSAHGFLDKPTSPPFRRGMEQIITWLATIDSEDGELK